MPPRTTTVLDPEIAPAIQMDPIDHARTSSYFNRPGSRQYREAIQGLIEQDRMRDAMAKEIRDVRRAAGEGSGDPTKYNRAMQEMLEYARSIRLLD
jgi:hypothetical protein